MAVDENERDEGTDDTTDGDSAFGEKRITAYCDRWSATPGETIRFMVNCEPETYRADVVKLICGDLNPDGPGYNEEVVDMAVNGEYTGREQTIRAGSHAVVPDDPALRPVGSFTIQALIYPTTPDTGTQGLLTKWANDEAAGYGLFIDDDGALALRLGEVDGSVERVSTGTSLEPSMWHLVGASIDVDAGRVSLHQRPLPASEHKRLDPARQRTRTIETEIDVDLAAVAECTAPLVMAGWATTQDDDTHVAGHYNGRIDGPRIVSAALDPAEIADVVEIDLETRGDPADEATRSSASSGVVPTIAAWDFAAEITSNGVRDPEQVTDTGPHELHGTTVNLPARAVPGHDWARDAYDFTHVPDQYGAIHFHDDDLVDAGWDVDFELTVPDGTESAVYAARLRAGGDEYYVPFYVRPETGEPTADVAFLAPTNSYLAYANNHMKLDGSVGGMNREPIFESGHAFLSAHREYGLSLYDTHADGSGSMFSSRLRPLINVAPKFVRGGTPPSHLHQFAADLYLIDWLEANGYDYDVVTDQDLHEEGVELLDPYNVVVTGHHPEYHSEAMFEAIEAYQDRGGRFMYLGGNGFYWVIAFHPDRPQIIETRRGEAGSESWVPEPGEKYHMFTGKKGGLWRERGWAPQRLVGVGTCGMWEVSGTYYRRQPDSYEPEVSFVFDGVDDEVIGDFGLLGGGAAAQEIDRYDTRRGSPEHAYLLAASEGHTEHEQRVVEEMPGNEPYLDGRMDPEVRADIVYYTTPNDGAVFSTGSMAWLGSLSHNEYDNNVSKITANVLEAFMSDDPLSE